MAPTITEPESSKGNGRLPSESFAKKKFNLLYQEEDADFIDYQLFPQFQLHLRGPAWDPKEEAVINAVGSARVFGRYLHYPFSRILTEDYGLLCRNIGFSGCTPAAIYKNEALLAYLRDSPAIPLIQVGAGDGAGCDWFQPAGFRRCILTVDNARASSRNQVRTFLDDPGNLQLYCDLHGLSADEVWERFEQGARLPRKMPRGLLARGGQLFGLLQNTKNRRQCLEQVQKCQDWIVEEYKTLADLLGRPTILLYFNAKRVKAASKRNITKVVKDYPQFLDNSVLGSVSPFFDETIVATSSRGMPYLQPGTDPAEEIHSLYPSPEMHRHCAEKIAISIFARRIRAKRRSRQIQRRTGGEGRRNA